LQRKSLRTGLAQVLIAVLCGAGPSFDRGLLAQDAPAPPPTPPPPGQTLTPDQLDGLVAPIALYPDPLISQILVASTYPLEVVEAYQWMQRINKLKGSALTEAVQQQNWDPSVQALVVFPEVMKRLNQDVKWTTNLGNAFLAQQGDTMDAIQRMRQKAQDAGKLTSSTQQRVVQSTDAGRPVIEIVPADPEVIYVPAYDPAWIWGPALWYPYPGWDWPVYGSGIYFGFGAGIGIGAYFGGWGGWGGWGWRPGWGGRTVFVNNTFITRNNFNSRGLGDRHGASEWSHDSFHRQGVPYGNARLSEQYRSSVRENLRSPGVHSSSGMAAERGERMGSRQIAPSSSQNHSAFGGMESGQAARAHTDHGYSSLGPARSSGGGMSAPSRGGFGGGGRRH
jgi:hypothetical protein